jgi:hypothetical protein
MPDAIDLAKIKMRTGVLGLILCAFAATSCGPSAVNDSGAADAAAIQALD